MVSPSGQSELTPSTYSTLIHRETNNPILAVAPEGMEVMIRARRCDFI
jgi:hypothetical protein